MEWPTPVNPCDGYVATLGDRFIIAFGVGGFSPIWPLHVSHVTGSERTDLVELRAMLQAPSPQPPVPDVGPPIVMLLIGAGFLVVVSMVGWRSVRTRHADR